MSPHKPSPRRTRARGPRAVAVALIGALALAAPGATAFAGASPPATRVSAAGAAKVKSGLVVLLTKRTVTPKAQRTVHFTGYATYAFSAPRGRRIVSASARIVGAEPHAVAIAGRVVSRDRKRYIVKLVFPGEQGNPGKLVVILGSVA
jgi:hypothetical protein